MLHSLRLRSVFAVDLLRQLLSGLGLAAAAHGVRHLDRVRTGAIPSGLDVELLACRFVENGDPHLNLGPLYRVWVMNKSPVPIRQSFSVVLVASNAPTLTPEPLP